MRIVSWNVNGLRSLNLKVNQLLEQLSADILCLQETKISRDMLEEDLAKQPNHNSYFAFSRKRSGYSGVATFCRDEYTPHNAEVGLSRHNSISDAVACYSEDDDFTKEELDSFDAEGRTVITEHSVCTATGTESVVIINVYCPRADPDKADRGLFKLRFFAAVELRARTLIAAGKLVIIVGDMNTSPYRIDHVEPESCENFDENPGRLWLRGLLEEGLLVDTYRLHKPDTQGAFTCWMQLTGARNTNYGHRLDYVLCSEALANKCTFADVLQDIHGSDHCPVIAEFDLKPDSVRRKPPSACTCYMPELRGTQQTLLNMFNKAQKTDNSTSTDKSQTSNPMLDLKAPSSDVNKSSSQPLLKRIAPDSLVRNEDAKLKRCDSKQSKLSSFFTASKPSTTLDKSTGGKAGARLEFTAGANRSKGLSTAWKAVLRGPDKPPSCPGHGEPCVLRIVKKPGPNLGREFYVCCRPEGLKTNPQARCDFFAWKTKR